MMQDFFARAVDAIALAGPEGLLLTRAAAAASPLSRRGHLETPRPALVRWLHASLSHYPTLFSIESRTDALVSAAGEAQKNEEYATSNASPFADVCVTASEQLQMRALGFSPLEHASLPENAVRVMRVVGAAGRQGIVQAELPRLVDLPVGSAHHFLVTAIHSDLLARCRVFIEKTTSSGVLDPAPAVSYRVVLARFAATFLLKPEDCTSETNIENLGYEARVTASLASRARIIVNTLASQPSRIMTESKLRSICMPEKLIAANPPDRFTTTFGNKNFRLTSRRMVNAGIVANEIHHVVDVLGRDRGSLPCLRLLLDPEHITDAVIMNRLAGACVRGLRDQAVSPERVAVTAEHNSALVLEVDLMQQTFSLLKTSGPEGLSVVHLWKSLSPFVSKRHAKSLLLSAKSNFSAAREREEYHGRSLRKVLVLSTGAEGLTCTKSLEKATPKNLQFEDVDEVLSVNLTDPERVTDVATRQFAAEDGKETATLEDEKRREQALRGESRLEQFSRRRKASQGEDLRLSVLGERRAEIITNWLREHKMMPSDKIGRFLAVVEGNYNAHVDKRVVARIVAWLQQNQRVRLISVKKSSTRGSSLTPDPNVVATALVVSEYDEADSDADSRMKKASATLLDYIRSRRKTAIDENVVHRRKRESAIAFDELHSFPSVSLSNPDVAGMLRSLPSLIEDAGPSSFSIDSANPTPKQTSAAFSEGSHYISKSTQDKKQSTRPQKRKRSNISGLGKARRLQAQASVHPERVGQRPRKSCKIQKFRQDRAPKASAPSACATGLGGTRTEQRGTSLERALFIPSESGSSIRRATRKRKITIEALQLEESASADGRDTWSEDNAEIVDSSDREIQLFSQKNARTSASGDDSVGILADCDTLAKDPEPVQVFAFGVLSRELGKNFCRREKEASTAPSIEMIQELVKLVLREPPDTFNPDEAVDVLSRFRSEHLDRARAELRRRRAIIRSTNVDKYRMFVIPSGTKWKTALSINYEQEYGCRFSSFGGGVEPGSGGSRNLASFGPAKNESGFGVHSISNFDLHRAAELVFFSDGGRGASFVLESGLPRQASVDAADGSSDARGDELPAFVGTAGGLDDRVYIYSNREKELLTWDRMRATREFAVNSHVWTCEVCNDTSETHDSEGEPCGTSCQLVFSEPGIISSLRTCQNSPRSAVYRAVEKAGSAGLRVHGVRRACECVGFSFMSIVSALCYLLSHRVIDRFPICCERVSEFGESGGASVYLLHKYALEQYGIPVPAAERSADRQLKSYDTQSILTCWSKLSGGLNIDLCNVVQARLLGILTRSPGLSERALMEELAMPDVTWRSVLDVLWVFEYFGLVKRKFLKLPNQGSSLTCAPGPMLSRIDSEPAATDFIDGMALTNCCRLFETYYFLSGRAIGSHVPVDILADIGHSVPFMKR